MKSEKTLLVLDLDGTITKTDNLVQFSLYMLKKKRQMKFLLFFPLVFLLKFRLIGNRKFKVLYAKWILKNLNIQTLNRCVSEFLKTVSFKNSFNSLVLDFIERYRDSEKMILSANYSFLVEPISKLLNIKNQVSIELEEKGNKFTGKITGYIPYGAEKVDAIKQFLNEKNYGKTIGLADGKSDKLLLKYLDEGYLVKLDKVNKTTEFLKI
jgi:HAD superfamily phosphoserine phosphatase-like hydrolase